MDAKRNAHKRQQKGKAIFIYRKYKEGTHNVNLSIKLNKRQGKVFIRN